MEKGGRSVVVGKKHPFYCFQQWFKTWSRHGGNILAAINRSLPKVVVVSKPQESVEMLGGHVVLQINAFSVCQVYLHTEIEMKNTGEKSLKVERLCIYLSIYLRYIFGIRHYALLPPTSSTTAFFLLPLIACPPTSTALSCVEARNMLCTSRWTPLLWGLECVYRACSRYSYMMLHTWRPDPWPVVQHLHWCKLPALSIPESPKSTESYPNPPSDHLRHLHIVGKSVYCWIECKFAEFHLTLPKGGFWIAEPHVIVRNQDQKMHFQR